MERQIQGKVVEFARHRKVLARKLSFGEGWPDYLFLYKGQVLFIEFKNTGEKQTALQKHVADLLREHGFVVLVIDHVLDGREAIRRFIDDADSRERLEGTSQGPR